MIEIGSRARNLPASPAAVRRSLVDPAEPSSRPWLNLLPDEMDPIVLIADEPSTVVWSSLWPSRPDDQVRFDLETATDGGTLLRFTLLAAGEAPDQSKTGHLLFRLNQLLFADLRYSYGQ